MIAKIDRKESHLSHTMTQEMQEKHFANSTVPTPMVSQSDCLFSRQDRHEEAVAHYLIESSSLHEASSTVSMTHVVETTDEVPVHVATAQVVVRMARLMADVDRSLQDVAAELASVAEDLVLVERTVDGLAESQGPMREGVPWLEVDLRRLQKSSMLR